MSTYTKRAMSQFRPYHIERLLLDQDGGVKVAAISEIPTTPTSLPRVPRVREVSLVGTVAAWVLVLGFGCIAWAGLGWLLAEVIRWLQGGIT